MNRWAIVGCILSVGSVAPTKGQVCTASRTIPPSFSSGAPFVVTISAQPDNSTQVYAVEDTPPAGWTVSNISHAGIFDATTGKVKWGLFFDHTPRILSYTLTSPPGLSCDHCFGVGVISCNGVNTVVSGDECTGTLCLRWYSMDAGGGTLGSGASRTMRGDNGLTMVVAVGQPDLGRATGGSFVFEGGFLPVEPSADDPTPVPALSLWGIGFLAVLILAFGTISLKQRFLVDSASGRKGDENP